VKGLGHEEGPSLVWRKVLATLGWVVVGSWIVRFEAFRCCVSRASQPCAGFLAHVLFVDKFLAKFGSNEFQPRFKMLRYGHCVKPISLQGRPPDFAPFNLTRRTAFQGPTKRKKCLKAFVVSFSSQHKAVNTVRPPPHQSAPKPLLCRIIGAFAPLSNF
jgi:hypothetical protein